MRLGEWINMFCWCALDTLGLELGVIYREFGYLNCTALRVNTSMAYNWLI